MVGFIGSIIIGLIVIGTWFAFDIVNPPPIGVECVTIWPFPPQCVPTPASIAEWWIWMISKIAFMGLTTGILVFLAVRSKRI